MFCISGFIVFKIRTLLEKKIHAEAGRAGEKDLVKEDRQMTISKIIALGVLIDRLGVSKVSRPLGS